MARDAAVHALIHLSEIALSEFGIRSRLASFSHCHLLDTLREAWAVRPCGASLVGVQDSYDVSAHMTRVHGSNGDGFTKLDGFSDWR